MESKQRNILRDNLRNAPSANPYIGSARDTLTTLNEIAFLVFNVLLLISRQLIALQDGMTYFTFTSLS